MTVPGDGAIFELDAPVTAFGMWMSQLCVQVGEPSVTPPHIDGESRTQLFGNAVAMDIVGLPTTVLWFEAAVGTGFAWSTPEKAYAPTITDVAPLIVTTMVAVPLGFVRYQKSASLLKKECAFSVRGTPPNVIETTWLLFASTPTMSSRLVPVPALKLGSVIW